MRIEEIRGGLVARLRERQEEIERSILTRVYGVSESIESADAEYLEGLRAAVSAAVDYGLRALESGERRPPPIPTALLSQARLAARGGVSLDTVLRRYLAGYTLLGDFVIQEAERGGLPRGAPLQGLLRTQAALFDRLLAAVGDEYSREEGDRPQSSERRRADQVKRLLAGELVDTADLGYGLEGHHLGVLALGAGAVGAIRDLASAGNRRLLLIHREEGSIWAWLGSRRPFNPEEVECLASKERPQGVFLALGEPEYGFVGWRLTHRQAKAALPIALRTRKRVVRYADVALLASMLRDDLLLDSLRQLYLLPLEKESDKGMVARETLRAYFEAQRNVSSAAAALGVTRRTVSNRLHAIERRLGRSLPEIAMEVEAALCLDALDAESPDLLPKLGTSEASAFTYR